VLQHGYQLQSREHHQILPVCLVETNVFSTLQNFPGVMDGLWNDMGGKFQPAGLDNAKLRDPCHGDIFIGFGCDVGILCHIICSCRAFCR